MQQSRDPRRRSLLTPDQLRVIHRNVPAKRASLKTRVSPREDFENLFPLLSRKAK